MKKPRYDTLIIGAGLAGCHMALNLHLAGEKVLLIGHPNGDYCSSVAAGLVNPIVPKGIASTWKRDEIFSQLEPYYNQLQTLLGGLFLTPMSIHQFMSNTSMLNEWKKASLKPENKDFVVHKGNNLFEIKNVYRLDVKAFLKASHCFFKERGLFKLQDVNHAEIKVGEQIELGKAVADKLLFCEGHSLINNPFFNYLPLTISSGVIGSYTINHNHAKDRILRNKKWCIPVENETYLVGSTFCSNDFSITPTNEEREEIEMDLANWASSFEMVQLEKGLRPTMGDRRPLLGKHPEFNKLFVYNGLGSKGCSLSVLLAPIMVNFMKGRSPLLEEVDIKRFDYTA